MTIHAVWFAYCDSGREDCPTGEDAAAKTSTRIELVDHLKHYGWKLGRKLTCPACLANIATESREGNGG